MIGSILLHPVPTGEKQGRQNLFHHWKSVVHEREENMKLNDKNISSVEEGTFMSENSILMLFLVWLLGVGSVGTNWQNSHLNKSNIQQARALGSLLVEPSATYHIFTHAAAFPLYAHPSSFSCCTAVLISSFYQNQGELGMGKSNKVMYMCVSWDINTICCLLLPFLSWAWLLASESLNALRGPWEIQIWCTSLKLLPVLSSSELLSLKIREYQAEAVW